MERKLIKKLAKLLLSDWLSDLTPSQFEEPELTPAQFEESTIDRPEFKKLDPASKFKEVISRSRFMLPYRDKYGNMILFAWFGGHGIHLYDEEVDEIGYWTVGDMTRDEATIDEVKRGIDQIIADNFGIK